MKQGNHRKPFTDLVNLSFKIKPYKNNSHTRESSISSLSSINSNHRNNSSNSEFKKKISHRKTFSSISPGIEPTIQQEITNTVEEMIKKKEIFDQNIQKNKQSVKEQLVQVLKFGKLEKIDEIQMKKIKKQVKNRHLEQIIKHFYPDIEKTAEIEDLFSKKIKRFFVAISKSRTFAVYSKDSGF